MMYCAKPYLNNTLHAKTFATKEECVKYLEEFTGIEMSWERDSKTKEKIYDWELVGKLFPVAS